MGQSFWKSVQYEREGEDVEKRYSECWVSPIESILKCEGRLKDPSSMLSLLVSQKRMVMDKDPTRKTLQDVLKRSEIRGVVF